MTDDTVDETIAATEPPAELDASAKIMLHYGTRLAIFKAQNTPEGRRSRFKVIEGDLGNSA